MPPTLKNFGLESAINDLFQKMSGSGSINASSRFHDYKDRLKPEKELIVFRVVQELINNILKHSQSSFIHLTQNLDGDDFIIRIHHDGKGIVQSDYEKLNKSNVGLGLKNISSRLRIAHGNIKFEKDPSQTYYKVTVEIPRDDPYDQQLL
jgi:signal transduction histidine kinase